MFNLVQAFFCEELNMAAEQAPIHVGLVEQEALEIIDLIESYVFFKDFAYWITDGKCKPILLKDKIEDGVYKRTLQYQFEEMTFLNGKIETYVTHLDPEGYQAVTDTLGKTHTNSAAYQKFEKRSLSKLVAEPYYTKICQIYYKGKAVGMSWEIFHLNYLKQIYAKKCDPLRFWRNQRA